MSEQGKTYLEWWIKKPEDPAIKIENSNWCTNLYVCAFEPDYHEDKFKHVIDIQAVTDANERIKELEATAKGNDEIKEILYAATERLGNEKRALEQKLVIAVSALSYCVASATVGGRAAQALKEIQE